MFCDILKKTDMLGRPEEWFNLRRVKAYCQVKGIENISFAAYAKDIMRHTTSSTGVFGVNFHVDQYQSLKKQDIDVFEILKFDKIYYLERGDKISQAYSLAKARVTDVWSSNVELTPEAEAKVEKIKYSNILEELVRISRWDAFVAEKILPKIDGTFRHEDVVADKESTCFKVLFSDLNIPFPSDFHAVPERNRQAKSRDLQRVVELKRYLMGP